MYEMQHTKTNHKAQYKENADKKISKYLLGVEKYA